MSKPTLQNTAEQKYKSFSILANLGFPRSSSFSRSVSIISPFPDCRVSLFGPSRFFSSSGMTCNAIHTWSFTTLVGAFLDLALAYLFLCGSAAAFFAAKFLGFFGFYLPCPCNGLFGDPNNSSSSSNNSCLQRFLVDYPSNRISSVQMSVKTKFPFDSIWMSHLNVKLVGDKPNDGLLPAEMDGEESCSSFSENTQRSKRLAVNRQFQLANSLYGEGGRVGSSSCDKGKRVLSQKPPSGIRRRRRAAFDHVRSRSPSVSSCATATNQLIGHSKGQEMGEVSSFRGNSEGNKNSALISCDDADEAPISVNLVEGDSLAVESNGQTGEDKSANRNTSFVDELVRSARDGRTGVEASDANTIKVLEQALEEEHAACATLYQELEKERSAAATACDEAMAMILRLQEEKASIEMEARQYQSIIEEKSAYDEEEMNILKEILLRCEREKHVLEMEVEGYRKMMPVCARSRQPRYSLNDMLGISEQMPYTPFESTDNPELLLQEISKTMANKEAVEDMKIYPSNWPTDLSQSNCLVKESPSPPWAEDTTLLKQEGAQMVENLDKHFPHMVQCMDACNPEFQEKGVVSVDDYRSTSEGKQLGLQNGAILYNLNESQPHNLRREACEYKCQAVAQNGDQSHYGTAIRFSCGSRKQESNGKDADQEGYDSQILQSDTDTNVHDVHVVYDKFKTCDKDAGKESERVMSDSALNVSDKCGAPLQTSEIDNIVHLNDLSGMNKTEYGPDIHRSKSDTTTGLLLPEHSQSNASFSNLRSNSLSAADKERLKLENEVGWLRERLKTVQKGREKLSAAVDHRERDNFQLQLLEEIAGQLREIRSLTEPGKAARRGSLPPLSSKVNTKKRRCRSVSCGHGCTD